MKVDQPHNEILKKRMAALAKWPFSIPLIKDDLKYSFIGGLLRKTSAILFPLLCFFEILYGYKN